MEFTHWQSFSRSLWSASRWFSHLCYLLYMLMINSVNLGNLHIGSLFIGSILYADDIALLACSCYGLQQLTNICNKYGMQWDIRFNPQKSQLVCFGGNSPRDNIITLGDISLSWSAQIKYLGCCFRGIQCAVRLMAWHSGRTSVSDWRTFPVLRSTCS